MIEYDCAMEEGPRDHGCTHTELPILDHLLVSAGVNVPVVEHAGLLKNRALLDSIER